MKRSNQEVSDESPFDQKRGRCSQLIDTLTTPKQTSIFTESIFNESIDPAIVEKLLCSNVLKRGDENGDVWELRKFFNLTDESVQLRKLCRAKGRVKYNASAAKELCGQARTVAKPGAVLRTPRRDPLQNHGEARGEPGCGQATVNQPAERGNVRRLEVQAAARRVLRGQKERRVQ